MAYCRARVFPLRKPVPASATLPFCALVAHQLTFVQEREFESCLAGASRQAVEGLRDEVMRLLDRHRVLTSLASRQQTPRHDLLEQMQHRQNLVELQRHLKAQHPADIAVILDSLPADDRLLVFRQLEPEQAGAALVEASEAVRGSLVQELTRDELVKACLTLDADDLAFLSGEVPDDVIEEVSRGTGRAGSLLVEGCPPSRREFRRPLDDAGCGDRARNANSR